MFVVLMTGSKIHEQEVRDNIEETYTILDGNVSVLNSKARGVDLCFYSLVDLVDYLNLLMMDIGEIVRISLRFYSGASGWISTHELLIEL